MCDTFADVKASSEFCSLPQDVRVALYRKDSDVARILVLCEALNIANKRIAAMEKAIDKALGELYRDF